MLSSEEFSKSVMASGDVAGSYVQKQAPQSKSAGGTNSLMRTPPIGPRNMEFATGAAGGAGAAEELAPLAATVAL